MLFLTYWKAFAAGNVAEMKPSYAPKVILEAGSELLKPKWGLSDKDTADRPLDRDELLGGYTRLIEKTGKDKWIKAFAGVRREDIAITAVTDPNVPGRKVGDRIVIVTILLEGGGRDMLVFVLRKNEKGQWRVVAERTDF